MHHANTNNTSKHGTIAPDDPGALGPGSNSGTASASAEASTTADGDDEGDDLEAPLFRSIAIQPAFSAAFAASPQLKQPSGAFGAPTKSFFGAATKSPLFNSKAPPAASSKTPQPRSRSPSPVPLDRLLRQWQAQAREGVYVLPCYYPKCEKRSATSDQPVDQVLERLFCCFKKLNIQASHDGSFATFGLVLRTPEQVELSLLIWFACKARTSVYVELDKRQAGCGGGPLKYICRILKAIKCCKTELDGDSLCIPKHVELQRGSVEMAERCRKMDLMVGACAAPEKKAAPAFAKTPAAGAAIPFASFTCVGDQTVNSLEMVWGLLKKPVTWSHGLELLGTISDPNKSGIESSKAVSKVILLGVSPMAYGDVCCRGIHEKLVHLMQSLVGESCSGEVSTEHLSAYQRDCLLQLVLTCLVNAMEVHIKFVAEGTKSMEITMEDGSDASVMGRFLESTKVVACDILQVLVTIVRRANTKPHHAYLAVKALFLLSSENSSIRQFVSAAMAEQDEAQRSAALKHAHEVGVQCCGLLEAECERLQSVLQTTRH